MAFGPKSAQRRARRARTIKHFAQRHGTAGRTALVDLLAAGLVKASLDSGVPGMNGPATMVHVKLQERGLPASLSFELVTCAVERAVVAFAKQGIPLL